MKLIATLIATMFAATVFAAEPAKAPATPAPKSPKIPAEAPPASAEIKILGKISVRTKKTAKVKVPEIKKIKKHFL